MPLPPYLQHFTDRQDQIAAFDALWPGDGRWILALSGVSGNGKSTLINWLIEARCKEGDWAWEKVDFYLAPPLEAVPRALAALAGSHATASFEQAAARARERYDAAIDEINRARAARAFAPSITQTAANGGNIEHSPPTIDARSVEELRTLYAPHQERLENDLARAALEALSALGARRAVLFLDTYERFAEASPPQAIGRLWQFLHEAAGRARGLRIIVGGRQDLPYPPLRDVTCWQRLGEFTEQDCDTFLREYGVDDAALRRETFALFKGHPLTTRMMAEAFEDARQAGQLIRRDDLRQAALARSHDEWLYGLVLQHLPEPLARAAKYGPLLRRFTPETLNAALDQKLDEASFNRLVTRAFVKPLGPGQYAFHETVRRVQIEFLCGADDAQAQAVRHRAILNAQSGRDPDARRDVLYHRCFNNPAGQFDAWRKAVDLAAFVFDHVWWNELLDVMQTPPIHRQLNDQQQADVAYRRGRWHYYHDGWDDALTAYAAAGPLYHAARDVSGEANVLQAIGDVQNFRKEMDAALRSYGQALELFRAVGDRLGEANVIMSRADVLDGQGQTEQALADYEQAMQLYRAIGDPYSVARALYYLGQLHLRHNNIAPARAAFEQAVAIFNARGLPDIAAIVQRALDGLS